MTARQAMEKLTEKDYYKLLGVSKTATSQEINKAYKKLAIKYACRTCAALLCRPALLPRRYHPDKNAGQKELAEENFKKVCQAYEVLSNQEKRATYDQFGEAGLNGNGMGGASFSSAQADQIFSQFFGGQDPFSVLFGAGGGMPGGGPGGATFQFRTMGGGMPGGPDPSTWGDGGGGGGGLPPGIAQMFGGMGGGGGGGGMPPGFAQMGGMGGMGGMPGKPKKRSDEPQLLPAGTKVVVRGLVGAAQHNGKFGCVDTYDDQSGRYVVALEEDQLRIKFDNLLQRTRATVSGMANRQELNGQTAEVSGYDESRARYHADIAGVGRASLQLANLILPPGCRGKVQGLTSAAGSKWNDHVRATRRHISGPAA